MGGAVAEVWHDVHADRRWSRMKNNECTSRAKELDAFIERHATRMVGRDAEVTGPSGLCSTARTTTRASAWSSLPTSSARISADPSSRAICCRHRRRALRRGGRDGRLTPCDRTHHSPSRRACRSDRRKRRIHHRPRRCEQRCSVLLRALPSGHWHSRRGLALHSDLTATDAAEPPGFASGNAHRNTLHTRANVVGGGTRSCSSASASSSSPSRTVSLRTVHSR